MKIKKRPGKFDKLKTYFHNSRKSKIKLKFSDIEKIIGCKLCDTAYRNKSYFYNYAEGSIANAWISQGFKITDFDDENKIIIFEKNIQNRSRVILPDFLFNRTIPKSAKVEIEEFFREIQEKYRL